MGYTQMNNHRILDTWTLSPWMAILLHLVKWTRCPCILIEQLRCSTIKDCNINYCSDDFVTTHDCLCHQSILAGHGLDDDRWHTVHVRRRAYEVEVQVDDGQKCTGTFPWQLANFHTSMSVNVTFLVLRCLCLVYYIVLYITFSSSAIFVTTTHIFNSVEYKPRISDVDCQIVAFVRNVSVHIL